MGQETGITERRITPDRRRFTYTAYSPERRSGGDRRKCRNEQAAKVA